MRMKGSSGWLLVLFFPGHIFLRAPASAEGARQHAGVGKCSRYTPFVRCEHDFVGEKGRESQVSMTTAWEEWLVGTR